MRVGTPTGVVAIIILAEAALGQDYPSAGVAYNTRENNYITYNCQKRRDENRIDCKFVQTSIRKKAKPEDLPKRLSDAKKQFPEALKEVKETETCEQISGVLGVIQGQVDPKDLSKLSSSPIPQQKLREVIERYENNRDEFGPLEAMAEFCKTKDEKDFLAMIEREFQIDSRTCKVGPNQFEQPFAWVDGYDGKGAWVVDEGPQGTCGLVQLSRFESVESKLGTGFKFWNYIARKAVTNPNGETVLGQKCGDLDQTEFLYSWEKPDNPRMGCEWIDYSPF